MRNTILWVYKNDFTGHWMVDRYGPKPTPEYFCEGTGFPPRRVVPSRYMSRTGVMGFRGAESAWAYAGEEVDKHVAARREIEKKRVALIARERELYPWLYEDEEQA